MGQHRAWMKFEINGQQWNLDRTLGTTREDRLDERGGAVFRFERDRVPGIHEVLFLRVLHTER